MKAKRLPQEPMVKFN